jgi:hypothetical protein
MIEINTPHNDRPGLWRLGYAARLAGMTPQSFEAASKAGRLPVHVERFGPRLAYVRAAEFTQWLKGSK